jgi:hypothetical protein
MKIVLSASRHHYVVRLSIFFITVALVWAMLGANCPGPEFYEYELTIDSTDGGNVTMPGEGTFTCLEGELVTLHATPDEGYRFVKWVGDVGMIGNVNDASTTIQMDGRYSIKANFTEILAYNLTVSATVGGWIKTPGEGTFPYDGGTEVKLEACEKVGYGFVKWTGDVSDVADVYAATTTIIMNGNYSIRANFEEEGAVTITDPNLEAAIREEIDIPEDTIYPSDLKDIEKLEAYGQGITDLTGLEHCIGLTRLYLYDNQISNISAVANLTSLRELYLSGNQISNISPLANLTSLGELYLAANQISNISALASLTSLTYLSLSGNQISNISALASLTSLIYLSLSGNQISNISALASLTSLMDLSLGGNQISDIKPLVDNPGLSQGDKVYLSNNPLSSSSTSTYIPRLEARGVIVEY